MLLRSGFIDDINWTDCSGLSALDYAALQGNTECVEILAQAGVPFSVRDLQSFPQNTRRLLISTLFERRRELRDLALSMESECVELSGPFWLDRIAHTYLLHLEKNNVAVPRSLRESASGSLFHFYPEQPQIVRDLISAGFTRTDEYWIGRTPLMESMKSRSRVTYASIQVAEILLRNGADVEKQFSPTFPAPHTWSDGRRYRAIHILAFGLGEYLGRSTATVPSMPLCLGAIAQNPLQDPCHCYCSPGGCTARTTLFKGVVGRGAWWSLPTHGCAVHIRACIARAWRELRLTHSETSCDIAIEFIRMLTFESLELTHTCCDLSSPNMGRKGPEQRDGIHEEETLGLHVLETLMEDFAAKFAELDTSLEDFITGYWRERMEGELYRKDQIPEDELNRIRELGVYLKDETDLGNDFFTRLWVEEPCSLCRRG